MFKEPFHESCFLYISSESVSKVNLTINQLFQTFKQRFVPSFINIQSKHLSAAEYNSLPLKEQTKNIISKTTCCSIRYFNSIFKESVFGVYRQNLSLLKRIAKDRHNHNRKW